MQRRIISKEEEIRPLNFDGKPVLGKIVVLLLAALTNVVT